LRIFLQYLILFVCFSHSICIVLEVCEYGSLSDVLRGANAGGVVRHALKLSMADRMYLAVGCARGILALHSYSPDLTHRDIKSFNFLIDSQLRAKVADLDLGEHMERYHHRSSSTEQHQQYIKDRDSFNSNHSAGKRQKSC
jgi:serine/threonine protein kinase